MGYCCNAPAHCGNARIAAMPQRIAAIPVSMLVLPQSCRNADAACNALQHCRNIYCRNIEAHCRNAPFVASLRQCCYCKGHCGNALWHCRNTPIFSRDVNTGDLDYAPVTLSESEADDEMHDLWDDVQPSPQSPITITDDDCHKQQDPSLGPCTTRLERISLDTDGDARGSIEAKKKEAPTKRTVKRARHDRKERVPGRTYRWVENCLETKPSLDTQVFMSDCGSDILVASRKDNLLDSSRCAYPCLSIAVQAAMKSPTIGEVFVQVRIQKVQRRLSWKQFFVIG